VFFQAVHATNGDLDLGCTIRHRRGANGREVDLVLYGDKGLLAFEAKRSNRCLPEMLKGLQAFLTDYPMARAFFIYGGERRRYEGKIELIPARDAFQNVSTLLV
jgi:hypothetical protein